MIWSFDKSAMDKVQSATDKLLLFEHELRMTYGDGKVSWLRSIWAVCLVKRIMGWMGSSLWCIRRMPGWRKTRSTVEYLAVFLVQRMLPEGQNSSGLRNMCPFAVFFCQGHVWKIELRWIHVAVVPIFSPQLWWRQSKHGQRLWDGRTHSNSCAFSQPRAAFHH